MTDKQNNSTMGKPTPEELETALAEAARMREQGEDPVLLGKCLLNLNYRIRYLENVMRKANIYLHSGEGAVEHAELVTAIEQAETASSDPSGDADDPHPW